MMKRITLIAAFMAMTLGLCAQENIHYQWLEDYARNSEIVGMPCANPRCVPVPDIPGYHAYKADLHMHTIFSDGQATPEMRVIEAWWEDLDILAITDHHPSPRTQYDQGDRNAGFNEAAEAARDLELKLIRGFEITGSEPVGHINVLFLKDLNEYNLPYPFTPSDCDSLLEKAKAEDAYIMTNHPGWPDQNSSLSGYVEERLANGTFQGIEIFNNKEFYPMAIDHANKYGVAMLACTDSHYPTYFLYDQENNHRDMTIIFAKDKSDEAIKEALRAGRTIAWADNILAGRADIMRQFLRACIKVKFVKQSGSYFHFKLYNVSDIPFVLQNSNPQETIRIPAQGYAEANRRISSLEDTFSVVNTWVSSGEHLQIPLGYLFQDETGISMPVLDEPHIDFSDEGMKFSLLCDEGKTYYTTDGSEPGEGSTLYDGGVISMSEPVTVRAVTVRDGQKSAVMVKQLNFSKAVKCKARKHGVNFMYYENDDILSTKDIEKIGVLKKKGTYPCLCIDDGEGKDHFGYVFTGYLNVPVTGRYEFNLLSNDGSDLFFGDALACDNDQHEGFKSSNGKIYLQKGFHKFVIRYFEGYGGESFAIRWRVPGCAAFEDVPADVFYLE